MKRLKRKLAIVLAMIMVLTNAIPVFADNDIEPQVEIETIQEEENVEIESTVLEYEEIEKAEIPEIAEEEVGGGVISKEETEPEEEIIIEEVVKEELSEEKIEEAFYDEETVDGVVITVTAEPGVIKPGTELWADRVKNTEVEEAIEEVVEDKREDNAQVIENYKFDIKLYLDGEEVEPNGKVTVSFALAKAAANADVNVYHIKEDENTEEIKEAEILESSVIEETEDEETPLVVEAESESFSYYVVEFTVGELQYVLNGDGSVKLSVILEELELEGIVTAAEVSNEELFTVEKDAEGDDWTVTALQAFSSEEWLKVTIDGKEYTIIVTDTGEFTTWEEFRQALLNAEDGATLKLTQNLTAGEDDGNLKNPLGKTVTIDLNGFTLDRNSGAPAPDDGTDTPVIYMPYNWESRSPSTLIIIDSSAGQTGKITGGKSTHYGGGISVNDSIQTLIIHGGNITGNVCSNLPDEAGNPYGSGIGVGNGNLIMDGGSVTNNTVICKDDKIVLGGAVVASGDGETSIVIGGNTVIKNNVWKNQSGSTIISSDLRINTKKKLTIGNGDNGCPAPENGMEIGAFLCDSQEVVPGAFTTNCSSDYVKYFFADYSDQYVKFETDHLELAEIPSGSHKINIGSFKNGSVTSDKQFAGENDTVTLTVSPDTGCHLKADTLKVTYSNGSIQTVPLTKVDDTHYTFEMPAYPVTVTAEFEETGIKTWKDLQKAIDDATTGATITLTQDLTASPSDTYITIPDNKIITLDLNQKTLDRGLTTAKTDGNVIRVGKGASLTVKNGTITGSHPNNGIEKGALRCEETTELNLNNVRFVDCTNVALFLYGVNSTNIEGCLFSGNTYGGAMVGGAAIDVQGSNTNGITITNCRFEDNMITGGSGSAIHLYVKTCDMTIKDSTFTRNHAGSVESDDDGGVICAYGGSLVLDGCTITGNTAAAEPNNNHCGGVSVSKDVKSFIIKGKTIIADNTCGGEPADLCLQNNGAKFKVEDLNPEAKIGVKALYGVTGKSVIAEGLKADDAKCFFSDDPMYQLTVSEGSLFIEPTENHVDIEYKKAGDEKSKHFEKHGADATGTFNIPEMLPEGAKDATIIGVEAAGNVEVNVKGKVDNLDYGLSETGVVAGGNAKVTVDSFIKNAYGDGATVEDQAVVTADCFDGWETGVTAKGNAMVIAKGENASDAIFGHENYGAFVEDSATVKAYNNILTDGIDAIYLGNANGATVEVDGNAKVEGENYFSAVHLEDNSVGSTVKISGDAIVPEEGYAIANESDDSGNIIMVEGIAKGDIHTAGGRVFVGKLEGEIQQGEENVYYLIGFSADGAGLKEFNFSGVSGAPTGVNGKVYNAVSANQIAGSQITITPKEAGKKINTSKLVLPAGVTKVEENGALILKFDANFKGGLQNMQITFGGGSEPSSDDTREPLFTGNWGNPVKNGAWKQDANGIWSYTSTETFRNTWGYIANPYAHEGQHQADWFYFDQYGHMLTGWQFINGKWYYLNPTKDGTLGACFIGPGKTPDGWEVDASGAWTGR